jgi:UrcA family protein
MCGNHACNAAARESALLHMTLRTSLNFAGYFMNLKLGLALTATLLLPAWAAADELSETVVGAKSPAPSVVVRYGDLDLKTTAGVRTLHIRLDDAAWKVCQQMLPRPVSIEGAQCRATLVEAAVADINQSHLASAGAPLLR